jgi:MFS family permease
MTIAPIAGTLADRFGERPFMVGGLLLQAVGMGWVALLAEPGLAYSQLVLLFIVAGVGVSMAIPSGQKSALGSVEEGAIGKAAGTNTMMRDLGGVFGIAVAVAVFAGAGSYASAEAFTDGFAPAIGLAAALSFAGHSPAWRCRGGARHRRRFPRTPSRRLIPTAGAEGGRLDQPPVL